MDAPASKAAGVASGDPAAGFRRPIALPLRIGPLALNSLAMLAPMAGVCDGPFKSVVRRIDRDCLLSTELVNGEAWLRGHFEMQQRAWLDASEQPVALQLSGHEPEFLAKAAAKAESMGANLVDLNLGCPAPKVVASGNGAALLRDPSVVAPLFEAMRKAIKTAAFTVKIRIGYDEKRMTGFEIARIAQECGADALWVHGRTKAQGYSGRADWEKVAELKRELRIPIIGNGDILTPEDAARRYHESGVDAVAIGRGAMGNPWIFKRAHHAILTGEVLPEPTVAERLEACRWQVEALLAAVGEKLGVLEARKHVAWYLKGLPGAPEVVRAANQAASAEALWAALDAFAEAQPDWEARPDPAAFGRLVDAKWMRYAPEKPPADPLVAP